MKTKLTILLSVAMLATVIPCRAMMGLDLVTKDRAKELGLEVRSNPAGTNFVRIELEFAPQGELTNYQRVELMVGRGDQSSLHATLKEETSKPGRIIVGFAVARADLDKVRLRIVTGTSRDGTGVAHDIHVKDFVPSEKTGADAKSPNETKFIAAVQKAFAARNAAGLAAITCWDGVTDEAKRVTQHFYTTLVEDTNVLYDFDLVSPHQELIKRGAGADARYHLSGSLTKQLNITCRNPADKEIHFGLCYPVGEKDGQLLLLAFVPVK